MLSPKMQRCVRVVDNQLLMLSDRARTDSTLTGNLHKKASDSGRWKNRYFVLYQVSEIHKNFVKHRVRFGFIRNIIYCRLLFNHTTVFVKLFGRPVIIITDCSLIYYYHLFKILSHV